MEFLFFLDKDFFYSPFLVPPVPLDKKAHIGYTVTKDISEDFYAVI